MTMKYVKTLSDYNKMNESILDTVSEFMADFDSFINQNQSQRKWLLINGFKMYVRKSKRYYNGNIIDCVDLATIESTTTGTGLFTLILEEILRKYPNKNLYVESILTNKFYNFFKKYGFVAIGDEESMNLVKLATN